MLADRQRSRSIGARRGVYRSLNAAGSPLESIQSPSINMAVRPTRRSLDDLLDEASQTSADSSSNSS